MSRGVPAPASFSNIIGDLFQNERICDKGSKYIITFSHIVLTDDQKSQLIYGPDFIPLNIFIIYQTDIYDEIELVSTTIELISFVKKGRYIYGAYFSVLAQPRYEVCELRKSRGPVTLSPIARLITSQYLEIYNNILGTTVILGLNSSNPTNQLASLQYGHNCRYFYENLSVNGITNPDLGATTLTGLSTNLHDLDC